MFNQGGLSLNQAPPIFVVLRFFITGALFGLFAGISLFFFKENIFDINSFEALIITHILALGVMGSFMLGALFQMLPVIAGVVIKTPVLKSIFVHIFFTAGIVSLLTAFYTGESLFYKLTALFLGGSLLYVCLIMSIDLFKLKDHTASSEGMLFSLISFFIAVVFALYLLTILSGLADPQYFGLFKRIHYSFALSGWIAVLILSISFQVIEMFYVTPAYPKIVTKYLIVSIFVILILKSVLPFLEIRTIYTDMIIAILFICYASLTLHRLYLRKRPTSDATVWFWRFGMIALILSMLFTTSGLFWENYIIKSMSYLTFVFFALSVLLAMVYKIVPFLVWFHLSNQGYMKAPLMHDIIHPKRVKIHFYIHATLFMILTICVFAPVFFNLASPLIILSFGWLLYHLLYAVYLYRNTQKNCEKISWQ